jgi:NADPH2 dehydrogenase
MAEIKAAFVRAAERAQAMGIDAVELHGAHGYLIHEFLSPLANHRDDEYGGSFENRIRFPMEVFTAVRAVFKGPLGMRLSASDWVEGGWDGEQSGVFAQRLKAAGCDFIHVSSGGVSPQQKIPLGAGYQVPLARQVRAASGLLTMAVGLITEPAQAEAILQAGDADLIALARAFLYHPRWGWQAARPARASSMAGRRPGPKKERNRAGIGMAKCTGFSGRPCPCAKSGRFARRCRW